MTVATNTPIFLSPLANALSFANLKKLITTTFGAPDAIGGRVHNAIDLSVATGTTIYAPMDGKIIKEYSERAGGNVLVMEGGGIQNIFAHLQGYLVSPNANVKRGDPIATSGATGLTTGPHLHWQVNVNGKSINPLDMFNPTGAGINLDDYKVPLSTGSDGPKCVSLNPLFPITIPANADGSCPIGFRPAFGPTIGEVGDVVGGVGEFFGALLNPTFWAAALAFMGGGIIMFIGAKMVWDSV